MLGDCWAFVKGYTGRPNTICNQKLFCRELGIRRIYVNDGNVKELCSRWYDLTFPKIHKQIEEKIMGETMPDYINKCDTPPPCTYKERMACRSVFAPARPRTEEDDRRTYLKDRLYEIRIKRIAEFRVKFKMDEVVPTTVKDLIARIEQGKYTLPDDETLANMEAAERSPMSIIRWRDPNYPADKEGFKAAVASDEVKFQFAKDSIAAGRIDGIFTSFTSYAETKE